MEGDDAGRKGGRLDEFETEHRMGRRGFTFSQYSSMRLARITVCARVGVPYRIRFLPGSCFPFAMTSSMPSLTRTVFLPVRVIQCPRRNKTSSRR